MKPFTTFAFALTFAAPVVALAQDQSTTRLAEIDGRAWLVDSQGNPFFAHGITHVGNPSHRVDYTLTFPSYPPSQRVKRPVPYCPQAATAYNHDVDAGDGVPHNRPLG